MQEAALITGASDRIGKAIALALASAGYNIALHFNNSEFKAFQTRDLIKAFNVDCETFKADLSSKEETISFISSAFKKFNIKVLVNSASLFVPDKLSDSNDLLFDKLFRVNFVAPYLLSREFAKLAEDGLIINILDTHISRNSTVHFSYLLTKKFLAEFTKMAAIEFSPDIRVNAIAPGLILPPEGHDISYLERLSEKIPLKKSGNVKNISETVLYFIKNDFITGQTIYVDGGENLF
jgi:pteridine reductase